MSSSVDTRVVEMQFDNASFQKGVAGTLASLEQLSSKLDSGSIGGSGLDKLKSAISSVSFDSIGSGLDGLLSKASTVFSGITGFVGTLSKTIAGVSGLAVLGGGIGAAVQAITGGSQRATNIENAKFMIEGLRKDWNALSDDINYAVDGTAYGFDAAANAAAQFSASGIEAGDSMKTALRGISGVAAMTNSDFESISHIFTAVAGQGKLMTIQLRQLELRGMNAAATLADYLGTSEEAVREMVSEGKIDFETFSAAMDNAFGEHAKEANKTFTGAVANMKAALNKIGADFFTPIHEMERQTALGFRLFFNSIREGLNNTPFELYQKRMEGLAPGVMKLFENVTGFEKGKSTIQSFSENMTELGSNIYSGFEKLYNSGVIQALVAGFGSINDALFHGFNVNVSALITAFFDKLSQIDLTAFLSATARIGDALTQFADASAAQMPYVVDILANLIETAYNLGSALASFLGPILSDVGTAIGDFFGIHLEDGASFLETLAAWTQKMAEVTGNLDKLDFSSVSAFIDSAKTLLFGDEGGESAVLNGIIERIDNFGESLSKFPAAAGTAINSLMDNLSTTISKLGSSAKQFLGNTSSLIKEFFNSLGSSKSDAKDAAASLVEGFGFDDLMPLLSAALAGVVTGVAAKLVFSISKVFDAISDLTKSRVSVKIPEMLDKVTSAMSSSLTRLSKALNKFATAELVKSVAISIGILAASLWLLSTIDTEDLIKAGVALAAVAAGLGILTFAIGQMAKSFTKGMSAKDIATFSATLVGIGVAVAAMAAAILVLTVAVAALSFLDPMRLAQGVIAVSALLLVLAAAVRIAGSIKINPLSLLGIAAAILALSAALIPIVAAVTVLSFIPWDKLVVGLGSFVGLLASVSLVLGLAAKSLTGAEAAKAAAFALSIGLLGASMIPIVAAVAALSTIPWEQLVTGLLTFVGLLTSVSLALGLASKYLTAGQVAKASGFAVAIGLLGAAMLPIVGAVAAISSLPMANVISGLAAYVLLLSTVSVVVGLAATTLSGLDIAKAAGFALSIQILGAAMLPITAAIAMLGGLPIQNIVVGLGSVIVALAAVTAVGVIASKFMNPAAILTLMGIGGLLTSLGSALLSISNAVAIMSDLPKEGISQAVDALSQIIVLFTVMTVISSLASTGVDFLGLTASLIAFGVALSVISSSIIMLAALPVDGIQQAASALLVMVLAFAALTAVVGLIPGAEVAVLALGTAVALLGVGLIAAAAGVFLFVGALATLASLGPEAAERAGSAFVIMMQSIAEGIVAFGNTLAQSSGDIANSTGEIGKAAAQGFATAAPEMGNAGVQAILAFVQGLGSQAGALATAGLLIIQNLLIGFASGIGDVIDAAAQMVIMTINGVANTIRNNASMLWDALGNVVNTLLSLLGHLIADGIEALFGPNPVSDAIRGWGDDMEAAANECNDRVNAAFNAKNEEMLANQQATMDKMAEITSSGGEGVAEAGETSAEDLFNKMTSVTGMIPGEIGEDINESLNEITSMTGDFESGGEDVGEAYGEGNVEGIESKEPDVHNSSQALMDSAKNVDSDGYSVGSNFGSGVVSGINAYIGNAIAAARNMINAAKSAANDAQNAASPSKDMMVSGGWFAQGFAIGIANETVMVAQTAASMVAQAMEPFDGIGVAMSTLLDGIDWDSEPVITPVLDTSQFERDMAYFDGLFPERQLVGASMLGEGVGASRVLEASNSVRYGDKYEFNLQYDAGADATDMVMGMANAMRTKSLLEA